MNFNKLIKLILDRVMATLALIVLSPVMLVVAVAIYFNMGSPVIFTQPRPGKGSKIFTLYKFRTMISDGRETVGDDPSFTERHSPDAHRVTSLGRFLRKTSLDELPQLWNVAKGDMSFVGPRPLLIEYLVHYDAEQARRQSVKPGITGWAQTHGRNSISWDEKFGLDLWYINHWSIWLDLRILLLTVVKVFRQEGINQDQATSMPIFRGNALPAKSNQNDLST